MIQMLIWIFSLLVTCFLLFLFIWGRNDRKYESRLSVSSAYDAWTNDRLLEMLWGEHVHLGYYRDSSHKKDFREAKVDFVHALVRWSGLDQLPRGSRVLDIGCGIGDLAFETSKKTNYSIGMDFSENMIKIAKSKFRRKNLQFLNKSFFEFKNEKLFDCISANGFMEVTLMITPKGNIHNKPLVTFKGLPIYQIEEFIYGVEEEIEKTTRTFSLNNRKQEENLLDALKITCRKYTKEKTGKKPITNINLVRI